jgi:hypothetical protein
VRAYVLVVDILRFHGTNWKLSLWSMNILLMVIIGVPVVLLTIPDKPISPYWNLDLCLLLNSMLMFDIVVVSRFPYILFTPPAIRHPAVYSILFIFR